MVGRCIPYWTSPFLGDMLVFRGVIPRSLSRLVIGWISAAHWLPAVHNGSSDWRQLHPIQIPGSRSPVLGNKILWILGKNLSIKKPKEAATATVATVWLAGFRNITNKKERGNFVGINVLFGKYVSKTRISVKSYDEKSQISRLTKGMMRTALRTTNQGFAWKLMFFSIQVDLFVQTWKIKELRCKKSLIPSTSIYW